ncbi:energy coupling factor transporter S component ThiW [Savagea faecisuis]|uniref:Energy coupling factor transporter S component ThiW n=1 Tax=Savagea faecisuis TaxID=1274803 RepID=A0ABW3H1H2_9BACL
MQNDKIRKMILISLFAAIAVVGSTFVSFPLGPARAFPVQHAINVIAAMMLGTGPGVLIAFLAALIRVIIGTGSLLAFPGGMIGAFLAGVLYKKFKKSWAAVTGEIIGTGLIASLFAVPYAKLLMGTEFGAFFFVPGFFFSSLSGAILGLLLVKQLQKTRAGHDLQLMFAKKSTN